MTEPGAMTRREVVAAGALGALALSAGAAAAAVPRRPNILFIMADDLGYADLSSYGRRDYATPNIDRLAATGVRFLQGYANSAVCSATRTALITGRYQYRLPIGLEEPLAGTGHVGLPPDHPTLPSLLRAAGYGTTLIGKWHLGDLPGYGPLKSGYDHFWGFRAGAVDYFSHRGPDGRADLWDDDRPIREAGYLTRMIGDRAVKTVADYAAGARPFFISMHFNAPHWPWEAPGDEAESRRLAGRIRDFDGGSQRTYAAMVQAMDAEVGRVLDALDQAHVAQDTIVVFTSDNGGERFSDTWPFSGQKTELLEGGLRVPAIVRWPGVTTPGTTSEQVMISMDWAPTLLAAGGARPAPGYAPDGIDLGAHLRGAPPRARTLFWRYKANRQHAMRDGAFKYLKILDNSFLFDVTVDPRERANLKDREPAVFARMAAAWRAWNATMLPETDGSYTENVTGDIQADHIGATPADHRAEPQD